jgi:hypothetical protein
MPLNRFFDPDPALDTQIRVEIVNNLRALKGSP